MTNADDLMSQPFTTPRVVLKSDDLFRRDSSFDTLPHISPFSTAGLRYAAPPVEWEQQQVEGLSIFSPTQSFTFAVAQSGNNIATLFPQAARIAGQLFNNATALLAVSLSYAITNGSFTGPIGLFVVIDDRPVIGVGGNADILVAAIVPQGVAAANWSDVRSNSFSLDVAPVIKVGQSVSLYCSCANAAADLVWGAVTYKYVQL